MFRVGVEEGSRSPRSTGEDYEPSSQDLRAYSVTARKSEAPIINNFPFEFEFHFIGLPPLEVGPKGRTNPPSLRWCGGVIKRLAGGSEVVRRGGDLLFVAIEFL
jgi:hypothetical protein